MIAKKIKIDWYPELSIYASEAFLNSVGDDYGWLGGFDDAGELKCILPYTIIRKAVFRIARFRVETIPTVDDLTIEEEKLFLNSVVEYLRSAGVGMIIPATTNSIFRTYPDGAVVAPYGTYIVDLDQPEEKIFGNFNTSHRRKVRVAKKKGVHISTGLEHLETAYQLVRDTFQRSKIPFMGIDAFKRMVNSLKDNIKIMVAYQGNDVQGCLVIPYSLRCAYYVYGGSCPRPTTGATNLLHWEAMRMFRSMGVGQYDFVGVRIDPEKGSKQEGLLTYKSRFGGTLVKGFMWKYGIRKLDNLAYSMAVRLFRGGDIVDVEKHKLQTQ